MKPDFATFVQRVQCWCLPFGAVPDPDNAQDADLLRACYNTNTWPATTATEWLKEQGITPRQEGHNHPALMPNHDREWDGPH